MDDDILVAVHPDSFQKPGDDSKRIVSFRLEPVIFLLFFSFNFSSVIFQDQIIKQTCTTIFGYNQTTCDILGTENVTKEIKNIEKIVQPFALKILMTRDLITAIIPAIVSLFIGPWSDKFGRKPVLLAGVTGFFLTSVLVTLVTFLSTIWAITPWIYIVTMAPSSLAGGICTLLGAIYCYTADITTLDQRPYKLALVGAFLSLGLFLGSLTSGYVYAATNAITVFSIATGILFIAVFYVAVFIEESVKIDQLDDTSKIRGFFQCDLVKDMFKTLFKRRENYDRAMLWILITVLVSSIFALEGSSTIFFLFVREKFSWTIHDYTVYSAGATIAGIIGGILGIVILQKCLGFSATSLALIGMGSNVIDNVIKTTATTSSCLYFGTGITCMGGIAFPMCRSLISNTVPPSDIGKIYSVTTVFEFLTPLASSPLYTYVYSATLDSYPSAFNAVSAAVYFFCFILITILFGIGMRNRSIA